LLQGVKLGQVTKIGAADAVSFSLSDQRTPRAKKCKFVQKF